MKYTLVLAIALAAISSCILANPGPGQNQQGPNQQGPNQPPNSIFSCIEKLIQNNATAKTAFITALTSAGFTQYINGTSVNITALDQHLMTVIQASAVQAFITTYVSSKSADIASSFSSILAVIQNLQSNATVINQFTGFLLIGGFSNYVSGSVGSFVIDFTIIQNDPKASLILNQFLTKGAGPGQGPNQNGPSGSSGPSGPFNGR